jgi:excisionase family DNA binding protein
MVDLRQLVEETPLTELPELVGDLARAQAIAQARLLTPAHQEAVAEPERVLTYAQAAEVMGCRESYVETLVRQHKLPVVPLSGTDKGGQARDGKYKRILLSSLLAHLKASEKKAVDGFRIVEAARRRR